MQRPLKRWFERITVKVCILLLVAYPSSGLADSDIDQSRSKARDAAGRVYQYLGTGEAIKQNAAQPITSSQTPMKTIDQSQSFSAQLSCPSTSRFVDLLVQPGKTGDLDRVTIMQDTNLDGQMDYQYTMPFPVSGICGNGVIQCDAGTWKNCQYWQWVANPQGQLSIRKTDLTKMGGCYCINNSCGNNVAWSNLALILKDLGAGATGAIMSANPQYSITDVQVSDAEITYYSQSLTECGVLNSGSATNPAHYYAGGKTDALMIDAARQEVESEQTDPESLYSVMSNASKYHNTLGQISPCKILRNISITSTSTCPYGNATLDSGSTVCTEIGNACIRYCDTLSGCQVKHDPMNVQLLDNRDSGIWDTTVNIPGIYMTTDTGMTTATIQRPNSRVTCYIKNDEDPRTQIVWVSCTRNFDWWWEPLTTGNELYFHGLFNDGYQTFFWKQYCTYPASKIDTINESINDQCAALEENPKCQIQNEKVDGVSTYKNYQPTGLIPIATCQDYNGFYSHTICRDWWEKDRTYLCQGNHSKFDFTDNMQRVKTLYGTTGQKNGLATYNDYRLDTTTNSWITQGNTFDLGVASAQSYRSCSNVCKTRKPKQDTQATPSGTTSQYRSNIVTYDFYYRSCYPSPTVCPAGAGEEILKDCQCLNEFAETFALVEALQAAGQDAICSSGVKQ